MKTEQPILITTVTAQADITKNLFIGFDGNLCAAGAKSLGVSNTDTDQDEELPVMASGIALVYSGASVSKGDPVEADANAKAIPVSAGEKNGEAMVILSGSIIEESSRMKDRSRRSWSHFSRTRCRRAMPSTAAAPGSSAMFQARG